MVEYNEDASKRTCEACGHVHEPFPIESWGWHRYAETSAYMRMAKQALQDVTGGS